MFDFILELAAKDTKSFAGNNLFTIEQNSDFGTCYNKTVTHDNFNLYAVGKQEQFRDIHEDEKHVVFVYGYAFDRLSSDVQDKKRLFAKDLCNLYEKQELKLPHFIKGSYVIAVYDKSNEMLNAFSDEMNIRNVYYGQTKDGSLVISSSLSAFSKYSSEDFSEVNKKSIIEYALFDSDLSDETFLKNVKFIEPGSIFQYSKENGIKIEKFWNIFEAFKSDKPEMSEEESFGKIEDLLKKNLALYLSEPDKTAFALTGGYDSRTNLALLQGKHDNGFFYSYGSADTYDIRFARLVAKKLKLNYNAFILKEEFDRDFNKDATFAIEMGDGLAEVNRANYVFVYKQMTSKFDHILTGLFGSELIKRPTSLGGYIDKNVQSLLLSDNIRATYDEIIEQFKQAAHINPNIVEQYKEEIFADIQKNKYINNEFSGAQKFFFYITGLGVRHYFSKELKVERPYIENLHPFLDIEFIELLLKSPFPWLYNWEIKKNLMKNLKIHKFYARMIHRNNKKLSNLPTTHAYRPAFLVHSIALPLLIMQYLYYQPKIKNAKAFKLDDKIWRFYEAKKEAIKQYSNMFVNKNIENCFTKKQKEFNKLISVQVWLERNQLRIES